MKVTLCRMGSDSLKNLGHVPLSVFAYMGKAESNERLHVSFCRARQVASEYENYGDLETTLGGQTTTVGFLGELYLKTAERIWLVLRMHGATILYG